MKRKINSLITVILTFTLIITSIGFAPGSYAAADTEGPEVDLGSMTLSTQTITDPHESPTVKLKVTDESGIQRVDLFYEIGGKSNAAGATLEYNEETGFYEGNISYSHYDDEDQIGYYGKYELWFVQASDYYGNFTNLTDFDAPNGNFEVVGGNPNDKSPPVIDYDNIVFEKTIEVGNSSVMTIPVADDSKILDVNVTYEHNNGNDTIWTKFTDNGNGTYQGELNFNIEGEYYIRSISATDANFNSVTILNGNYFSGVGQDELLEDLGFLNIQYGGSVPTELTASIKSAKLSSGMINRNEEVTITLKFDASSPLESADASYDLDSPYMEVGGGISVTKIDDYTFSCTLPSQYYGKWIIKRITARDIYGNSVVFADPERFPFDLDVEMDFESGDYDYYVGIVELETGLGVSDSRFDDTTELLVDEETLNGELCEEMLDKGCTAVGMYDVEVEGTRDDKTAVSFVAPDGIEDGDEVSVVHKRHNGKHETFWTKVKHGRITIETDEFSPFLIQVETCKHQYMTKNAVPATCISTGLTEGKECRICGKVSVAQKKISMLKHKTVRTEKKKATLTSDGKITNYCKCGKVMSTTNIDRPKTFKLSYSKKIYTGASLKAPTLTVRDREDNLLKNGTDYTIKYKNASGKVVTSPKAVGRYKVVITFKGKYSGSKNMYFTIVPKAPATATARLSTGPDGYNDIKFSWSKSAGATGYTVYYKKSGARNYTYLTRTTGTFVTKEGLKDGSRYYFKVVPYYKSGDTRYTSLSYKTANCYTLKKMAKPKVTKSGTKVKVSWTNINGETGYQISRSTKKKGTNIVYTYKTTTGKSKVIAAKKGVKYYYKLRGYKSVKVGEEYVKVYGPWSNVYVYRR